MITDKTRTALSAAYDAALAAAHFDKDTIRWINRRIIEVTISGVPWRAMVEQRTPEAIRLALADCLNQHCSWVAAHTVHAGGR